MSPDGIPAHEWNRVQELIAEAARAMEQEDLLGCQAKTEEIVSALRQLRVRYGNLPGIVDQQLFKEEFLRLLSLHNERRAFLEKQQEARNNEPPAGGYRRLPDEL